MWKGYQLRLKDKKTRYNLRQIPVWLGKFRTAMEKTETAQVLLDGKQLEVERENYEQEELNRIEDRK